MISINKNIQSEIIMTTMEEIVPQDSLFRKIDKYIDFYNKERPHTYLRYWTPDKYEEQYYRNHQVLGKIKVDNYGSR